MTQMGTTLRNLLMATTFFYYKQGGKTLLSLLYAYIFIVLFYNYIVLPIVLQ